MLSTRLNNLPSLSRVSTNGPLHHRAYSLLHWVTIPWSNYYRQVPRKPRLACPVTYEVYLTGVGGDESAQFRNNKITFPGCPALPARLQAKLI
jgi:hypothetical protein